MTPLGPTPHAHPPGLLDIEEPDAERVALVETGGEPRPAPGTFKKIGSGIATVVAMIVLSYVVPAAEWTRPWTSEDPVLFWNLIGRELMGGDVEVKAQRDQLAAMDAFTEVATRAEDDDAVEALPDRIAVDVPASGGLPAYQAHPDDTEDVPQSLELPNAEALDRFYAQLAQTQAGFDGALTRVSHWGDSAIASDHVTSALRTRMQMRFGDAGHGWHLVSTPTLSYRHRGIRFKKGDWANCYIINSCRKDGHYGFGGTVFTSNGSSKVTFGTTGKGALGRKVSRFELWYAAEPRGGPIKVSVDDGDPQTLEGRADVLTDRVEVFEVPDGPHEITVRVAQGKGRLYGVVLERDGPGVVWDGLSNLGAFTGRMLNADPQHMLAQIDRRDPHLIVFQFGGNDLIMKASKYGLLERQTRDLIRMYRGTQAPRACLVISPVDHGERKAGRIVSVEAMEPVTALQRKVALEEGCAFFDTQAAMGGPGAIALWRERNLMSADLAHLSDEGQQVLGHMIYLALMQGYRSYRERG